MSRTSSRAALVLAALVGLGCATMSVEKERQFGRDQAQQLDTQLRFVHDSVVVGYIDRLGREIVEKAGPQPFEYTFQVVEDDDVNAFAAPGGYVYVNTGLILKSRNVAELAGVMAHEIGHVVERHVAENYNKQRTAGAVHQISVLAASIAAGPNAGYLADAVVGLSAMSLINSFTRDAEREADTFAVAVLPKAGYDPMGAVTLFELLQQEGGGGVPEFLSSHPSPENRIEQAEALIREMDPPPGLKVHDGGRLEIIQQRIELLTSRGGRGGANDPGWR